jgi:hypothetical protein
MRERNANSRTTAKRSPPEAVAQRRSLTSHSSRAPLRHAKNEDLCNIERPYKFVIRDAAIDGEIV